MRSLLSALCLLLAAPALAEAPKAASSANASIPKAKLEKIHTLLKQTHADKVADVMLAQFKQALPPAQYEKLASIMKNDEMMELLVPIYDRHFTEQDLDGIIAFYKSPLGQKLIGELPAITQESMQAGQNYARQKLQQASGNDAPHQ